VGNIRTGDGLTANLCLRIYEEGINAQVCVRCVGCVSISGRVGGVDACQSIMWLLQSSGWKVLIMPLGTVPNPYQIFPVFNMQITLWTVYCFCGLPGLCVFRQTECARKYLRPDTHMGKN